MTPIELLAKIASPKMQDAICCLLYHKKHFGQITALSSSDVFKALDKEMRFKGAKSANRTRCLQECGAYIDRNAAGKLHLWSITASGEKHVKALTGILPHEQDQAHDVAALKTKLSALKNQDIKEYFNEAISCLSVGCLKASIVFLWAGAVRQIQEFALNKGSSALNAAISKHDPKAKIVSKMDDFSYIKESILIQACQDLGIFDKAEKGQLEVCLNLRNSCGHPGNYKPGEKKASGFIEDILSIVFK